MTKKHNEWKRMSEKEFNKIKQLHAVGVTAPQIKELLGNSRATSTISRAWQYDTLDAYRASVREERQRWVQREEDKKAKIEEVVPMGTDKQKPDAPAPTPDYQERVLAHMDEVAKAYTRQLELMRIQTSAMERQAAATERLADAWQAAPKKTGFLGR